jgi:hypothetical protein
MIEKNASPTVAGPALHRERNPVMSESELSHELRTAAVEPLLPIEKKLIGWSLGIGVALLIVLVLATRTGAGLL